MIWTEFQEFMDQNPHLGECLGWYINGQVQGVGPQEFFERYVEHIAIQPWDSLPLNAPSTSTQDEWLVHFRIRNDNTTRAERIRSALEDGTGTTVSSVITGLKRWHGLYWAKQPGDHTMKLTAIVRQRQIWAQEHQRMRKTLDVYVPPAAHTL